MHHPKTRFNLVTFFTFFGDLMSYPNEPTDKAQVDSDEFDSELLGENELGSVHIHGPFGNADSNIKIAYLIGMHPLESKSHRALFEKLTAKEDLKYCYYLYNINVNDKTSETEGRLEGQKLAWEFVAPHIINEKYDLFLDIHSNRGSNGPGDYQITNFVFAPGFDEKSTDIMNRILADIDEIQYYAPEFRSSPPYITEPTSAKGIATIVYECYSFEPMEYTCELAEKLIDCVDNLF